MATHSKHDWRRLNKFFRPACSVNNLYETRITVQPKLGTAEYMSTFFEASHFWDEFVARNRYQALRPFWTKGFWFNRVKPNYEYL